MHSLLLASCWTPFCVIGSSGFQLLFPLTQKEISASGLPIAKISILSLINVLVQSAVHEDFARKQVIYLPQAYYTYHQQHVIYL